MKFCARKEVSFSWKVSILIFHEAYIAWFASISLERTKSTKNHPKFELAFSGLEELTVFVTPHGGFSVQHLSSQDPFITMISVWYALELLPGLQMRFLCHPSNFAGECSYAYAVQIFVIGNFLLKSTTCVFFALWFNSCEAEASAAAAACRVQNWHPSVTLGCGLVGSYL